MFIACGINHKTAPIHFREKLAVPASLHQSALEQLIASPQVQEITLLSTCNRTELYCQAHDAEPLKDLLADVCHLPAGSLDPHWYSYRDNQGIKHALRVACGLDSMMLGEPQILGQFKQAYVQACALGTAKSSLKQIFSYVFRASKHIRNQSGINNAPISVAYAAAQRILQFIESPSTTKAFIIGSGEMATLVAKYLYDAGVRQFLITSRTDAHAQKLAERYAGEIIPLTDLDTAIERADVVITASTCPVPFITPTFLAPILSNRTHRPLFLLDLAVPRNITAETAELAEVTLCNIDELHSQCEVGHQERQVAANYAETLVDQELVKFVRWSDASLAKQLITDYRTQMKQLSNLELTRAMQAIDTGESIDKVLEKLTHRLFKKLTHLPTLSLRQAAQAGYTELLELLTLASEQQRTE